MSNAPNPLEMLVLQLQEPQQVHAGTAFCTQCLEDLPLFVSDELSCLPVDELYPQIAYHLDLCDSCLQQYVALAELMDSALSLEERL